MMAASADPRYFSSDHLARATFAREMGSGLAFQHVLLVSFKGSYDNAEIQDLTPSFAISD
jgi:hypothetical protein